MTLRVTKIRQRFDSRALADPIAVLRDGLARLDAHIRPDSRIAITVGSRGIANLVPVVQTVVSYLKARGAEPFVVPAMGSHGGATAPGQVEVLQGYGITEAAVGAPVRATMEAVQFARRGSPVDVFMDRNAVEADGVVLINRIKPHTDFHGRYESGLMKMALIGLGKQHGALAVHRFGVRGLREFIGPGAQRILAEGKIIGGVALVEDAYHATMAVEVLKANEIPDREPALLDLARQHMARLPVKEIDVLVVDRMGKDISGVGIDPNITGRIGVEGEHDSNGPRIGGMVVCDLTDASHGNAIGVGLADVITRRLYDKIDREVTDANVLTSGFLERGKVPIAARTDRDAFDIALLSCARVLDRAPRVIRIADTLNLEDVYVSRAVLDQIGADPAVSVGVESPLFDAAGCLMPF